MTFGNICYHKAFGERKNLILQLSVKYDNCVSLHKTTNKPQTFEYLFLSEVHKVQQKSLSYKKKTILGAEHSISHCFIINNKNISFPFNSVKV